ncbi:peptidyl-tRNA hydrolase [Philodulcilactobacillus myokoensis]|uniref:Peptidyl-tRNA hydrolase n=1 Tax=Philodulcilactobacillus myokoensis TaxID=2929573 RepID=A0A9W6B1H4_9LACO|nr:aminoacyl-tRNA hydrolase [Philodulcilactobacillus myokoensis]GLB47207.1 peptidyl-tRNA hydrolase [Philodulcilactobacillus myokoensis]
MKMIVGLGNIGSRYDQTRHNTGFMVVDKFADQHHANFKDNRQLRAEIATTNVNGEKVIIVKPTTFMNDSGEAVAPIMKYYKINVEDMIVVYDDMDLPVGKIRLRDKGASGGHNGIKSIVHLIGTHDFNRVRVGTSHPKIESVVHYVLGKFTPLQKPKFEQARDNAIDALLDFISGMKFYQLENKYN